VAILFGVFNWITDFLLPPSLREQEHTFLYRVAALSVSVGLVTVVGWVTRLVIGRRLVTFFEAVIARVPLLNKIYAFMKEVSQTLLAGQKTMFDRVVLVEYPRPGAYTIAFATADAHGEAQVRTSSDLVSIILPTPPNPTTGYLALFPREQVVPLEMSVSDAMKMSFSGGAVVPPYPPTGAR
jgi:uncharacterized membrane protein